MRRVAILALLLLLPLAALPHATKASSPYILVVNGGERINRILDALQLAGYQQDVDFTVVSESEVTASLLQEYLLVIWSELGVCERPSSDSQSAIATYLDSGGKLIIFGEDIGYEIGGTSWYETYLKADYVYDYAGTSYVNGSLGTPFEGLRLTLNSDVAETNWPDVISPLDGAQTILVYSGGSYDGYAAGILYHGDYDLIYISFNIDAIDPLEDLATLLDRCIKELLGISIELPPASKPGDVNATVHVHILGEVNMTVFLDGTAFLSENVTGPTDVSLSLPMTTGGYHNVTVVLYNATGFPITRTEKTIYIDDTPPTVTLGISDGAFLSLSKPIPISASDDYSLGRVEVYLNGTLYTSANITGSSYSDSIYLVNVTSGKYKVTVKVYDYVGWYSSKSVYVTVDVTAPAINITVPDAVETLKPVTYVTKRSVRVSITVQDDIQLDDVEMIADVTNKTLTNVGEQLIEEEFTVSINESHSAVIFVWANDSAGNEAADRLTIVYDASPPKIAIKSPANGSVVTSGGILLSWIAWDDHMLRSLIVIINETIYAELSPDSSGLYLKFGRNGKFIIKVIAVDGAGNAASSTLIILVNATEYGLLLPAKVPNYLPYFITAGVVAVAVVAIIAVRRRGVTIKLPKRG